MRRVVLVPMVVVATFVAGGVGGHQGGLDDNGGHHCREAGFNSGLCAPLDSYHCHQEGCTIPAGETVSTVGAPDLPANRPQVAATPTPTQPPGPVVTPSPPIATPAPSVRALSNTGLATDVLGLSALSLVEIGVTLVLLSGWLARRRRLAVQPLDVSRGKDRSWSLYAVLPAVRARKRF